MRKGLAFTGLMVLAGAAWAGDAVVVVRGSAGLPEYGERFEEEAALWAEAARTAEARWQEVPPTPEQGKAVAAALQQAIEAKPERLWVLLCGHGTFDGREARFNVEGPDFTPKDLQQWLRSWQGPLVLVHTGSASQPFAKALAGPERVCVTATKSGSEVFSTRFGLPFARAMGGELKADLDQDGQVSVLEAFLDAAAEVRDFYQSEERLATEHALLDDDGDGVGTRSERFDGVDLREKPGQGTTAVGDGARARRVVLVRSAEERQLTPEQRARRDELEMALEDLKKQRDSLDAAGFEKRARAILLELARMYEQAEAAAAAPKGTGQAPR
ncbi:MAG: hypothetical protein KDK99_03315 [Verrucomicrobiales bacterium]|nr:hypothetical protein [Verrucomicrobiales bacterium]